MNHKSSLVNIIKAFLLVSAIVVLAACGSSQNDVISTNVSGSVGDGPITGATVEIFNAYGDLIGTEISDETASYTVSLELNSRDYPLIIKTSDGIDLVTGELPDFEMVSVVMSDKNRVANINPFSTLIVKMAQTMPDGVTAENVAFAKSIVADKFAFGLDVDVIDGPVTTEIDRENVAQIVKASEAMGEMVRRSRDLMTASGTVMSGDDIVDAIATDLADGFLDGMGAEGSNPTVSAVANLVTGQVLVETLTNSLKVNGVYAAVVMDQAILTTHPEVAETGLIDSVRITAKLLNQVELAVAAAKTVDGSSGLASLERAIKDVKVGSTPDEVAAVVSTDASRLLDKAIKETTTADPEKVVNINLAANDTPAADTSTGKPAVNTKPDSNNEPDQASQDPVEKPVIEDPVVNDPVAKNTSPAISGSPAKSVTATKSYSFKPNASDADGDALSFKVSNKPAWASFSASTGKLSGVPANGDVGSYGNIVITVSDGSAAVKLSAFSIQVKQQVAVTGSMSLNWTAPSTRADGTPLSLADIDGYRIYYGANKGDYTESVDIMDGTADSAKVTDLPVGAYHVVMTTYDGEGRESGYSGSVQKTVQ